MTQDLNPEMFFAQVQAEKCIKLKVKQREYTTSEDKDVLVTAVTTAAEMSTCKF